MPEVLSQAIQERGRKIKKKLQTQLNKYTTINDNKPKQALASAPAFFQEFHHTLCAGLLGKLRLAGLGSAVLRNVSGKRLSGTAALAGCHREARRGGTDRHQAVLCSLITLYCPRCTWAPGCTYSTSSLPGEKRGYRKHSRATFACLSYSVFNDHHSSSVLYTLIPENFFNKSLYGCQILAFNGVVPGSTRDLSFKCWDHFKTS